MEVSSSTKQTVFSRTTNLREWPSQNWVQFYLRRMLQVIKTNDQNNSVANSLVMSLISKLPKESLRFLKYNTHVTIIARLSQLMSCVQHTLAWVAIVQLLLEWNDNPCQCYHVLSMVSLMTCCCFWKEKALNSLQCLLQVHNDLTRIETEPFIQESNPLSSLCYATTLPQKWKYSTVGTL